MMATEIKSKHATVSRPPYQLYMAFVDMRNFVQFLPEDKKKDVTADYDSIKATVQGFPVGVRVSERVPYSRIEFSDDGAPFKFTVVMNFDPAGGDLMMKMMLGSRLKDALDKMVDALAAMSEGKMSEGMDASMFPEGFDPSKFNGFQS